MEKVKAIIKMDSIIKIKAYRKQVSFNFSYYPENDYHKCLGIKAGIYKKKGFHNRGFPRTDTFRGKKCPKNCYLENGIVYEMPNVEIYHKGGDETVYFKSVEELDSFIMVELKTSDFLVISE